MEKNLRNHVFTSGEASLNYLKKFHLTEFFFHVGPPRDFDLFNNFKNNQSTDLNNSQYLFQLKLHNENTNCCDFLK